MAAFRSTLAIATFGFLLTGPTNALAQQDNAPPPSEQGATGRGVRIVPPEPVSPPPVANPPQPVAPVANAVAADPAVAPGPAAPAALKPCDRPVSRPTLRFDQPDSFDSRLRAKLRRGRTVVVDLAAPYAADKEAPPPLGAWLNEVKQSGGTVEAQPYCVKGRGIGGFFAKLFGGGPAETYKAARRYDAVLHVDALDQVVTQVSFTPRKARP